MRTKSSICGGDSYSCWSPAYFDVPTGARHERVELFYDLVNHYWNYRPAPVKFTYVTPLRVDHFETCSDLPLLNTRSHWNDFEHYKRSLSYGGNMYNLTGTALYLGGAVDGITCLPSSAFYAYSSKFGPVEYPTVGLRPLYDVRPEGFIPLPPNVEALKAAGVRALLPRIKTELSVINSLLELDDIKSLFHTCSNLLALARKAKVSIAEQLRAQGDVYLQQKFNILPLISDVAGVRRVMNNLRKQIERMLAEDRKVLTRHFMIDLDPSTYTDSSEVGDITSYIRLNDSPGLVSVPIIGTRSVRYTKRRFHVEIQYSYFLSGYEKKNIELLALLDGLGINLNPKIVWNAIPWSFVIDWLAGVANWLDQFKITALDPVVWIHRCLYSVDVVREVAVDVVVNDINSGTSFFGRSSVRPVTCTESSYIRRNFWPGAEDITFSGLSPSEISLGAALAFSRQPRRHHRTR